MSEVPGYEAIHRAFRNVGLIVSDPSALPGVLLPSSSRDFLVRVGLPKGRPFGFDFELARTLPLVRQVAEASRLAPFRQRAFRELRCIGENHDQVMAIDPHDGGKVVWIDLTAALDEMFVNTRVELLGACLADCLLFDGGTAMRKDPVRRARVLREQLHGIDNKAIEHPRSWWAIVLQEIELGII